MSPVVVLLFGFILTYIAATGRLEAVWNALKGPGSKPKGKSK